jgi:hypothetical protein
MLSSLAAAHLLLGTFGGSDLLHEDEALVGMQAGHQRRAQFETII